MSATPLPDGTTITPQRAARRGLILTLSTIALISTAGVNAAFSQAFTLVENPVAGTSNFLGMDSGCIAWGDYNGDGLLDFFTCGYNDGPTYAELYRNNGDGTFTEDTAASANLIPVTSTSSYSCAWGDIDNDGDLDLISTGNAQSLSQSITRVYRNDGPAGGGSVTMTSLGNLGMTNITNGSVVVFDHNNDGNLDLLISGLYTMNLYQGDGAGAFTHLPTAGFNGTSWGAAAAADYDRDGNTDILAVGMAPSSTPSASLYRNNGDGTFTANSSLAATPVSFATAAWADYDNDGWPDFALAGQTPTGQTTQVYRNAQDGTFSLVATLAGISFGSLAWGDYDNDGLLDLAVSGNSNAGNQFLVYRNTGAGFSEVTPSGLIGLRTTGLGWADYDSDGHLDLLINGVDDAANLKVTRIYRNNSTAPNTAPSAPTGLSSSINGLDVTFTWNAATDDNTPQAGLTYNLRIGTSTGITDVLVPAPDGKTGNQEAKLTHTIRNLTHGEIYYWSVQAIDTTFKASPYSAEAITATVPVTVSTWTVE